MFDTCVNLPSKVTFSSVNRRVISLMPSRMRAPRSLRLMRKAANSSAE